MTVAELREKARAAEPPAREQKASYRPLFRVMAELRGRGFSLWQAAGWLVAQGAIPATKRRSCHQSALAHFDRLQASQTASTQPRQNP